MKHYKYTDYKISKIIFECDASNIIEADKLFLKKTGKNASKESYITCSFE